MASNNPGETDTNMTMGQEASLFPSKSTSSPQKRDQRSVSPEYDPKAGENRLRPAGDIINRITWDSAFERSNYVIGFVDRFEGQLEVTMGSWKKETTDEEFIPQHRVLMDISKKKPSLPRLTTMIPLLQKPPNASCNAQPKTFDASAPPIIMPERPARTSSLFKEDKHDEENTMPVTRVTSESMSIYLSRKNVDDSPLTKVKKLYYEDAFTARGSHHSPKDRVNNESVVVVELKTSTKAKDDASKLLSEFAHFLAQIYQRPETSMLVTIDQNADLLFGNTLGSAYLLKITALSSLIGPLTNLRNTGLIQSTIQEMFGIAPDKGVVIYTPVSEDNLATNGMTAKGEIDRLERIDSSNSPSMLKSISRSMSRRMKSSSENSAPISLVSVMSPDVATPTSTSPVAFASGQLSPPKPHQAEEKRPMESPKGEPIQQVSSKDEKCERSLKKRESLKSFVNRRLGELGELTTKKPFTAIKGKKD
ncbi:Macrophage migration inhibitory factor [Penicillium italicum]|uniref:L-dopachrome isomerase n=1 Tax=Penicillium italicum TaxID=40296 RepID=A0A0A2L4G5_PENIT|nr:Macrophage migration inhibitory factor [Penicillium italicum]